MRFGDCRRARIERSFGLGIGAQRILGRLHGLARVVLESWFVGGGRFVGLVAHWDDSPSYGAWVILKGSVGFPNKNSIPLDFGHDGNPVE